MTIFVCLLMAGMLLGAGAMLAPALRTSAPHIGLAAVLCLALILGGATLWTYLVAWDMLVFDYIIFGLMAFVVLGGTLADAQTRAEAQGTTLDDADMGWLSRRDLLLLLVSGALVVGRLLLLPPVSAVTADDISALLAGTWSPADALASSPASAYLFLTAYLSDRLGQAPMIVASGINGALLWVLAWALYDAGTAVRDRDFGMSLMLVSIGVIVIVPPWSYGASGADMLLSAVFGLAFVHLAYLTPPTPLHDGLAGIMLGAVVLAHVWLALVLGCVYGVSMARGMRPAWRWLSVPVIALVATVPYTRYWVHLSPPAWQTLLLLVVYTLVVALIVRGISPR